MIHLTTKKGIELYLSKSSVKEIVINPNEDEAILYTDRNSYLISLETAKKLSASINEKDMDHLTTAINNLTQMIRARVH